MSDELKVAKKTLRALVLSQRDAMPDGLRAAASTAIVSRLRDLPAYQGARAVLMYMGFGTEVNTEPFFDAVCADGKMAVLPKINKNGNRSDWRLTLHPVAGRDQLAAGVWGIREPLPNSPQMDIAAVDLALIPGVAFDRHGRRLGYGGGFYDRLLAGSNPAMLRVCAAFDCQVVDVVPAGDRDQRIHIIITEKEIITCP
jgi:5-formyltetrahydrofolate cyclo-ligase